MRLFFKKFSASILIFLFSCGAGHKKNEQPVPVAGIVQKHCDELIGKPRIEKISEHVWAAISYDLANTILIETGEGHVIVDTGMSPARSIPVKKALLEKVSRAPIKAIIYTHSHGDHIGGASVWEEKGTEIWATDAFTQHFFKQYGLFRKIEIIRARRQFGDNVSLKELPCNGIGRRVDIRAALKSGILLPTHTFSGKKILKFGSLTLELVEAHGETHDQLFVWIPEDKTLIAGDNFYWAFPNLYTIRGSSPRPVDDWINSLDKMRKKEAEHLVPCHTKPLHGKSNIARALTNYRDSIQWVRDEVVRGANLGKDVDTLAEEIKLPGHLAKYYYNREFYGQIDWSVRAIYSNNLGWFDGRADKLYPPESKSAAGREVELMGGKNKVLEHAKIAIKKGDAKWAIHLLAKIKRSGMADDDVNRNLALGYEKLAAEIYNLNGRGYLLESALEIKKGILEYGEPVVNDKLLSRIPLELIFSQMIIRLKADDALDVYETVHFVFPDEKKRFIVTVRKGIAELALNKPLPGTPEPIAEITVNAQTYRKIALNIINPVKAFATGKIKVKGSWIGCLKFLRRFKRGV